MAWKSNCLILGEALMDTVESSDHVINLIEDIIEIGVRHIYTDYVGQAIKHINVLFEKIAMRDKVKIKKTLIKYEPFENEQIVHSSEDNYNAEKLKNLLNGIDTLPPYFDDYIVVNNKIYSAETIEQFFVDHNIDIVMAGTIALKEQKRLIDYAIKKGVMFNYLWPV